MTIMQTLLRNLSISGGEGEEEGGVRMERGVFAAQSRGGVSAVLLDARRTWHTRSELSTFKRVGAARHGQLALQDT